MMIIDHYLFQYAQGGGDTGEDINIMGEFQFHFLSEKYVVRARAWQLETIKCIHRECPDAYKVKWLVLNFGPKELISVVLFLY